MTSKKLATALGAGTLGAGGATGTAAWQFGLFERLGLGDGSGSGAAVGRIYFSNASEGDKKAVDSEGLDWQITLLNGLGTIRVEAKKNVELLWRCELIGVSVNSRIGNEDRSGIGEQKRVLEEIIKDNAKRRRFVENCSKTRISEEDTKESEIYLEVEKNSSTDNKLKFKNFEKLWIEDVEGIYRVRIEDEWIFDSNEAKDHWKIEAPTAGKVTISVEMSDKSKNWSCSISGNTDGSSAAGEFKEDELKRILELGDWGNEGEEKKKYLVRNCTKNNRNITGLTIQNAEGEKWRFDDASLKKISEGMYENPK